MGKPAGCSLRSWRSRFSARRLPIPTAGGSLISLSNGSVAATPRVRTQIPSSTGGEPVATIANNNESAEFLLTILVDEAQTHGEDAAEAADNYDGYATKLAKVMSQLSPDEQRMVFYGSL